MAIDGFASYFGIGKSVYTYSPLDVSVILDGHQITGFIDGAFISIELPQEQQFRIRRAADGSTYRSYHPITGLFLRITLNQSSPSNDFLNDMLKTDTVSLQNFFSLMLKDNNGSTALHAGECFIMKAPDVSFSTSIEEREWVVYCSEISEYTIGGNEQPDGLATVFNDVINAVKTVKGLF